jgi:5,10-methylenetetrahydrofolate reductase
VISGHRRTRKQTRETVYVITSLSATDADHHQIAQWLRGHWAIEVRREVALVEWNNRLEDRMRGG